MTHELYPGAELPDTLTGHALRQVCFDVPDVAEYRRAFWGHLWRMAQPGFWERTEIDDTRGITAAEYWAGILFANQERFYDSETCDPEDNECRSYPPTASFIQWFPNDPVYSPDFVGEGYNSPAWYLATPASNIALGSSPGDVITSIDRFPPGSLPEVIPASGLPRFRINVVGEGTVKATLVNLIAGSLIQTTVDDDILTLKFTDVSRDLVSLPPESQDALTLEFEFTTPGNHWIDFIVVSWVNSSIPFLHHGGGLRKVELCGFVTMPVITPPFRFNEECGLEYFNGEEWIPVDGWDDFAPTCFTGPQGPPGEQGETGPAGPPGEDGATLFIRDTGDGQLQTSPDEVDWANVPNAHYLHINADNDPLTGDLQIHPPGTSRALEVRKSPDGTNPIIEINNPTGGVMTRFGSDGRMQHDNSHGATFLELYGINFVTRVGALVSGNLAGQAVMTLLAQLSRPILITGNNNVIPLVVAGWDAAATSDLQQWRRQASDSFYYGRIKNTGAAEFGANTTSVASAADALTLYHATTGTPAQNFGTAIRLQGQTSTTPAVSLALLKAVWEDATHATRKAQVSLAAYDTFEREFLRGGANGTDPTIGFLGQTPSARIDMGAVDAAGNEAAYLQLLALEQFGLIEGTFTEGEAPEAPTTVAYSENGVYLPENLPAPNELSCDQLCHVGIILAANFVNWTGYLIRCLESVDKYDYMRNVWVDTDPSLAVSGFNSAHFTKLELASEWYDDYEPESLSVLALEAAIDQDDLAQAIFNVLVTQEAFDDQAYEALKEIIIPFDATYGEPITDALDVLIFPLWQRLYYIATLAEDNSCDCVDWFVDMNFMTDDWDGAVTLVDGVYQPPYVNEAPTRCSVVIEVDEYVISATITVSTTYPTIVNFHPSNTAILDTRDVGIGTTTFTFTHDCPDGFDFSIGQTPCEDGVHYTAQIRRAQLAGVGTAPTP